MVTFVVTLLPTMALPEPTVTLEAVAPGAGEGVGDGDRVGDGDGEGLGLGDGDGVGDGVGDGLGVGDGDGEGPVVGDGDGDAEGVGDSVGPAVGDGEGEGLAVGDGEGDGEGVGEGLAVGEGDGVGDGAGSPVMEPFTGTAPDTLPSKSLSETIVSVRVASPAARTCQVTAATLMVGPASPSSEKELMVSCPVLLAVEMELVVGFPEKEPSPPATELTFTFVLSKSTLKS